jgi:hypothetical protein
MTAISEECTEDVRLGNLSGPPPVHPLDWLGEEVNRHGDDLALAVDQREAV